jgi:hypothetical protein
MIYMLVWGYTDRQHGDSINILVYVKTKKRSVKMQTGARRGLL